MHETGSRKIWHWGRRLFFPVFSVILFTVQLISVISFHFANKDNRFHYYTMLVLLLVNLCIAAFLLADILLRNKRRQKQPTVGDILEKIEDGFIVLDRNWVFTFANQKAKEIMGKPSLYLLGANIWVLFPDWVGRPFYNACLNALREMEVQLLRSQHLETKEWFETKIYPSEKGISVYFRNIQEKVETEKALVKNDERLQILATATNEIIFEWDTVNDLHWWNDRMYTFLGYAPNEVVPSLQLVDAAMHPEDLVKAQLLFNEAILGQQTYYTCELRMKGRENLYQYFYTRVFIIYEETRPVRVIGAQMNISELRKTQAQLEETNEELRSLSAYLQNIREEERTRIAREIHDELGQQLTALKIDTYWLKKHISLPDEGVEAKLEDMNYLINEAAGTVKRLTSSLRPPILDNFGLIAALEWLSEETATRTGIRVEFVSTETAVTVSDKISIHLFRIYQEALHNAIKHAEPSIITGSLEKTETELILCIQDDGKGFIYAATKAKKTFGLLGIKERVNIIKGRLEIWSQPGRGTQITVSLPSNAG